MAKYAAFWAMAVKSLGEFLLLFAAHSEHILFLSS